MIVIKLFLEVSLLQRHVELKLIGELTFLAAATSLG